MNLSVPLDLYLQSIPFTQGAESYYAFGTKRENVIPPPPT